MKQRAAKQTDVYAVIVSHFNHYRGKTVSNIEAYYSDRALAVAHANQNGNARIAKIKISKSLPRASKPKKPQFRKRIVRW